MTRQPDPPDEAALRALAEEVVRLEALHGQVAPHLYCEATIARLRLNEAATPQAVLALLATLADLRARLAAVEADLDTRCGCRFLDGQGEVPCESHAEERAQLTAERDAAAAEVHEWRQGYQPVYDQLEAAEQQRDTARAEADALRFALSATAGRDPRDGSPCWCESDKYRDNHIHHGHCQIGRAALSAPEGR